MNTGKLITSEQINSIGGQTRRFKSGFLHTVNLREADIVIDDQWVKKLTGQTKLVDLNLEGSDITDSALETLSKLSSLETLDLSETLITDRALDTLKNMHHLKVLALTSTQCSQEKIREIRAAMLNTRIIHID